MSELKLGNVWVATSNDGGHGPEFYADRIVDRLISVAETAPEPIKAQALVFKESMRAIVLDGIKRAIASDRATLNLK